MKKQRHLLTIVSAVALLIGAVLGCDKMAKQPDWTRGRKIAGRERGLSHISGLVVDDKFAYVSIGGTIADQNEGTSGLRKVALDSGLTTSVDNGEQLPQSDYGGMAIDDKYLYWNASGKILRVSREGGKPETVASEYVGIGIDIVVDNENIYWSNHGYYSANSPTKSSPIYFVSKKGGKTETFTTQQNIPHSLIIDEQFVYWLTPTSIFKQAKSGGQPQLIYQATDKEGVDELAQDNEYLYFGFRGEGESRWALRKVSKQGGEPQTVVKRYSLKPVAVDDANIYFFDENGIYDDVLCKVSNNGGEVVKLDTGYASGVIAQSKTQLYFAAGDDIYSFAK